MSWDPASKPAMTNSVFSEVNPRPGNGDAEDFDAFQVAGAEADLLGEPERAVGLFEGGGAAVAR